MGGVPIRLLPAFGVISVLALASACTGCLSWRSQVDPYAERLAAAPEPTSPVTHRLLLSLTFTRPGIPLEQQQARADDYLKTGLQVLRDSGRFAHVGTELADPDLELVLNVVESQHLSLVSAVLAGLSVFIVPVPTRVDSIGDGGLYSESGRELRSIEIDQRVTTLVSWLLLPASPFALRVEAASVEDVFESALAQMLEAGSAW